MNKLEKRAPLIRLESNISRSRTKTRLLIEFEEKGTFENEILCSGFGSNGNTDRSVYDEAS